MNKYCTLCLSADRHLNLVEEKHWKTLYVYFSVNQKSPAIVQFLHSENLIKICWECCAKINKFNIFLQCAQRSCAVFAENLALEDAENLVSESKLCTTEMEIIDLPGACNRVTDTFEVPVVKKENSSHLLPTCFVKLEKVHKKPKLDIIKIDHAENELDNNSKAYEAKDNVLLDMVIEDEYKDDDVVANDNVDDSVDMETSCTSIGDYNDGDTVEAPSPLSPKKCLKVNTKSQSAEKVKMRRQQHRFVPRESQVSWVLESQALQWYKEEREAERQANPTFDHQCDVCQRVFPTEEALTEHFKEYHNESAGSFLCNLCRYRFTNALLLKQHQEKHYAKYLCDKCSYETRMYAEMESHVKENHARPSRCARCKEEVAQKHQRTHRKHCSLFKCSNCEETFNDRKSYANHTKTHKKQSEGTTYCEGCKSFIRNTWYEKHFTVSLRHISRDTLKFTCEHCGEKRPTASMLRLHIFSVHLKSGAYHCDLCPNKYMTQKLLDRHLATRHKIGTFKRARVWICELCGKGFMSNTVLIQHRRTHTGERPFKCEYCPASYISHGSLYTHNVTVHHKRIGKGGAAEAEKITCNECGKTYPTKGKLKEHIKCTHLNVRYRCDLCDKCFTSKYILLKHKRTRHSHVATCNYPCKCGKSFETEKGLKNHKHFCASINSTNTKQKSSKQYKCRECDETFKLSSYVYVHYKVKHLQLRSKDRVSIKNLFNLNKEVVVIRDPMRTHY